jgi:transcriptional regulator with XRE-family HTH domain
MANVSTAASERLRQFRTDRGWKMAELAAHVGCSESWISQLESEKAVAPGLKLALDIERVTGITAKSWPAKARKPRKPRKRASEAA